MKKFAALVLSVLLCTVFISGCGTDGVSEELEQFLNVDMIESNKLHSEISEETKKWEAFTKDKEAIESIEEVLIPAFDGVLKNLSAIKLETEEVKEIKEKYQQSMSTYKEGYNLFLEAFTAGNAELASKASAKIREAEELLTQYNGLIETLAEEKDLDLKQSEK